MTHCIRCRRPLKKPTESGMGPVCARRAPPAPVREERNLFGYDVEKAAHVARAAVAVQIEQQAIAAHSALRAQFRAARVRLGVWSA